MKNLREEIGIIVDGPDDMEHREEQIDKFVSLIDKHVKEVIGEQEETNWLEHKAHRNILRDEQLERHNKIIGKE